MTDETNEPLSLKGNRDTWLKFTYRVKKIKGKTVWDVLEPYLKDYIKKNREI